MSCEKFLNGLNGQNSGWVEFYLGASNFLFGRIVHDW